MTRRPLSSVKASYGMSTALIRSAVDAGAAAFALASAGAAATSEVDRARATAKRRKRTMKSPRSRRAGGRLLKIGCRAALYQWFRTRSEEHTSELQSLMRISYAVFC